MGNLHGKNSKSQSLPNGLSKTDSYDASWIESIERSFVVVWCDPTIGSTLNSDDDTNTFMQLARIMNTRRQIIHTFNEVQPCQEFITHVNNICLIVSGSLGEKLVPLVHDLDQIHSIYIFCINKPKHELWSKPYGKVHGVFTDIRDVCECLKTFLISRASTEYDQLQFDILKKDLTFPTVDNQELPLQYDMACKLILLNMNLKKKEMIDYCRMEYTTEYQTRLIDEFENNYAKHNPIWWFTRDHFFQGIVNQALRTHDLYSLCKMSPFIQHLNKKITDLHKKQMITPEPMSLYFSQLISNDDFEALRLNQGGLMCINQFLFANSEPARALMCIEHQTSTSVNTQNTNVLFEISVIKANQSNVPFANIGSVSQFVHEKEYLFLMESIFRIDKIGRLNEISSAWFVHVTLLDKYDPQITSLPLLINQDHDLPTIGNSITNQLYEFKSINKILEQLLNSKTKRIRSILLHYNMGITYHCSNEFNKALEEYKLAIKLIRSSIPNGQHKDNISLVPLYSNIGKTYQQQKQFTYAFEDAFRALSILTHDQNDSIYKREISASCYHTLGVILDEQGRASEAKSYHDLAVQFREKSSSADDPNITIL